MLGILQGGVLLNNLFAYCSNDPVMLYDILGYQPKWARVVTRFAKGTLAYKAFLLITQKGWCSNLFWIAGFFRTDDGVYHTRQDCWQQFFGYNDLYDWAFNIGTSMKREKFPFFSGNKEYIFWAWKGDYYNLGAGAELGIYSRLKIRGHQTEHWLAATKMALPMKMTLKLKGQEIANYNPNVKQWWITSFNPYYQNVQANTLSVSFTICFTSNKQLFNDFYDSYGKDDRKMWVFNLKAYTATLSF